MSSLPKEPEKLAEIGENSISLKQAQHIGFIPNRIFSLFTMKFLLSYTPNYTHCHQNAGFGRFGRQKRR